MCADSPIDELERELTRYVTFQRKYGEGESYDFASALKAHRRQVLDNLRDEGGEMWFKRNGLLEKLADQRGIDLTSEPQLRDAIAAHKGLFGKEDTLW